MDKFVKRIQSRLTAKKILFEEKTVPLWKCRQFYEVFVADRYNPTDEEMNLVIEKLTEHCTTGGAEPETTSIEPIPTPETFDTPVEDLPCLQPPTEEEAGAIAETTDAIAPGEGQETASIVPQQPAEIQQPTTGGITQAEVTQAISQAAYQVGVQGDAEAIQALTSLATILSVNNKNTEDMVAALVSAYLNERQRIFSSAIGTLNTLRIAQTESFQAGLDPDFFQKREQSKLNFLNQVNAMFN